MTLRAEDTLQQSYLPVLSPQQRQNQFGLSGRGERFRSEADKALRDEEDVVEIQATAEESDNPRVAFNPYAAQQNQNFQNGSYQNDRNQQQVSASVAAGIYEENELNQDRPFYLGSGLDFVA